MHREEREIHADKRQDEVDLPEPFVVHPARHRREEEVHCREEAHHGTTEQHVVEVRDHPVGLLELVVHGNRRLVHARDAADREETQEAEREQHRGRETDAAPPHGREPVEDLHARRHGHRHRGEHERGADREGQTRREHVVRPNEEADDADAEHRDGHRLVTEDRLPHHLRDDLIDHAHRGQDHDVHRGMGIEPEQVLPQDRVPLGHTRPARTRGHEEARADVPVEELSVEKPFWHERFAKFC